MKYLVVYTSCIKTALHQALAYRLNFTLSLLITLGSNLLFPLVTVLIYNMGASFPGWRFGEVLLLQSIFVLSNGLAGVVFSGVLWSTMQHVREGSFEVVLLKPSSPLFFLIVTNFDVSNLGLFIGGLVLFGISLTLIATPSIVAFLSFLVLFLAGFAVMAGVNLMMAATSFKWVGNSRIPEIFESFTNFGKYPLSIFPNIIRGFASFIIPVGVIAYYPASALLGEMEPAVFLLILPCLLFLCFGVISYRHMVKLYEGVGG